MYDYYDVEPDENDAGLSNDPFGVCPFPDDNDDHLKPAVRRTSPKMAKVIEAQSKELTSTMLQFNNDKHLIAVVEDVQGYLTCTVSSREPRGPVLLHTIRFPKKIRQGVLWRFMGGFNMSMLAFEPNHPGVTNH